MHRFVLVSILSLFTSIAYGAEMECPELTGLQVAAGFVTWMNVLRVFAIAVGAVCVVVLLFKWFGWLLQIFVLIPVVVYEVFGYVASVALVVSAYWVTDTNQLWPLLGGSLLFAGMLVITHLIHELKTNEERFFGILFIVWTATALAFESTHIGFIAVGALMGMLGFSAAVIPMGFAIGFRDRSMLSQATSGAFLVLALFVIWKILESPFPVLQVFEQGALWFGSFVGFLGLLIASSVWYANRRVYPLMQLTTIAMGMVAIAVGSLFDIPQLLGVGGTFFALYLIEKPFEIPTESVTGYAIIGLLVSCMVGASVWWAQNNMEIVQPYLLF